MTGVCLSLKHSDLFDAILNSLKTNIFRKIKIIFTTNQFQAIQSFHFAK